MADQLQDTEDMILPDDFDPEMDIFADQEDEASTTEQESDEVEESEEGETEEAEETEEETTESPEAEQPAPAKARLKVKFNHQEMELDEDQAVPLIQKGMNYEKVQTKAQELEAKQAKAEALARMMGFDNADAMIEAAETNYVQNAIDQKVAEMVEAGVPEPIAKDIARRDPDIQKLQELKNAKPAPAATPPKDERAEDLDEFVRLNPGVTKLPEEVIAAVASGQKLTVAYERYKAEQAQKELKILKQNQSSASKAPVASTTRHGSAPAKAKDPFDMGFDSE